MPLFYGVLIGDGQSRTGMVWGYVIGGLIMMAGGVVELLIGIKAEGQSLETVTKPLTSVDDGGAATARRRWLTGAPRGHESRTSSDG